MRKIICLIMLVGLLAISSISFAADIDGWRGAKWGMTYSEVSKVLKMGGLRKTDSYDSVTSYIANMNDPKEDYIILKGFQFLPAFGFDKNKKLIWTHFLSMDEWKSVKEQVNIENDIKDLFNSLIGKYGEPSRKWIEDAYPYNYLWSTNSGSVHFGYGYVSNMYSIKLHYSKIDDNI